MVIFIGFFLLQTSKSPIFIKGFVYQCRSGLENMNVNNLPYDVKNKLWGLSRGYQELCKIHFCRMMFVDGDIADTTVPNLFKKNNVN
jgi:hypothetical protein